MLKHRRSKKRNPHISINQFRNKRETWAELTFAKTPATVTGDRENFGEKLPGTLIPCNDPRGLCETQLCLAVILLQIVMVSPGTYLVKNHESQSRAIKSLFKKQ